MANLTQYTTRLRSSPEAARVYREVATRLNDLAPPSPKAQYDRYCVGRILDELIAGGFVAEYANREVERMAQEHPAARRVLEARKVVRA